MAIVFCVTGIAGLSLKACNNSAAKHAYESEPKSADSIVGLPGSAVLIAPNGTVARELVDWLATHDQQPRRFELGGTEFAGRSIEPTIESKVRIKRLATMLKAYPDVTLHVIGYSDASGYVAADQRLSEARAAWLVQALSDSGIARSRLTAEGRGGADPLGDNASAQGRAVNERVAVVLAVRHRP